MKCICIYNPVRDLGEVCQFGFVNLHDALINNRIPADLKVDSNGFNEMEIDAVGRPIRDNFDAIDAGRNLDKAHSVAVAAAAAAAQEEGNK